MIEVDVTEIRGGLREWTEVARVVFLLSAQKELLETLDRGLREARSAIRGYMEIT
jgi:hypothetical protein